MRAGVPPFAALGVVLLVVLSTGVLLHAAEGAGAAAFAAMQRAWAAGDLDKAIDEADKVLKAEPRNVAYLNRIGALYCAKALKANLITRMSWGGKCRSTWEGALGIDPANIDIRFNLIGYYAEAPAIAGGGMDKAKAQATAIAALDAVRGEIAWGHVARHEERLDEAERRYRKAAEIDPAGMRGPVELASFLVSQKRWADAKAVFEPRLAKRADDVFAAFQLGRLWQAEGVDLQRALQYFDRCLAGSVAPGGPTPADVWFRKGQVLEKLGMKSEAIAAYESALALAPALEGARLAIQRLRG
jgi:hypothetical protein